MRRRHDNELEEHRVADAVSRLWRRVPAPSERTLQEMARTAAMAGRTVQGRSTGSRPRLRWAAAAAAALLVASGLGVGFGTSLTANGTAEARVFGFGFLAARGWTVVQSRTTTEAATAVAANVPLHPDDAPGEEPYATLETLPRDGIVISATFTTRGDPEADARFDDVDLPLQVASADASTALLSGGRTLGEHRLRAGVGGYNIDATIYYGRPQPSRAMLRAAQQQLAQLVVAAERVTLFARPIAGADQAVSLFGSVDNGRQGETVTIQARDCGQKFFRAVAGATTRDGGGWSTEYFAGISTTLRAVWNEAASAELRLPQRVMVRLRRLRAGEFEVSVVAKSPFWRKRALFQRFDSRLGTWKTVKSVVLTQSGAAGNFAASSAKFSSSLPRGVLVRAFIPLAQARPCYLAGASRLLRT